MTDLEWFVLIYGAIGVFVVHGLDTRKGVHLGLAPGILMVLCWGAFLLVGLLRKVMK